MVKKVAATSCCIIILVAFVLEPQSAFFGIRNVAAFVGGSWHSNPSRRQQGGTQHLLSDQWSMAPGERVHWSAPSTDEADHIGQYVHSGGGPPGSSPAVWMVPKESKNEVFLHGRSMLEESDSASTDARKQRPALVAKMHSGFKAAFENPLQVSQKKAAPLKQMQKGLCNVLWGKTETVRRREAENIMFKSINFVISPCHSWRFKVVSGGNTNTWKECAAKVSSAANTSTFFSWLRKEHATAGECTLLEVKDPPIDTDEVIACLENAKKGEIAVSGYGLDSLCTSCLVSEWATTPCSAWCEAGVSGRYRTIVEHENLNYCQKGTNASCDRCPHLWELASCNQGVKCGAAIQPGKHYCPEAKEQSTANTETWQECSHACMNSFSKTGGQLGDPTTFMGPSCFRYSFHNTTSTCELKSLAECNNSLTTADPLWISGDVLTSTSDHSTVEWSAWGEWSSCDGIDLKEGWKKRVREPTSWGFRNDGKDVQTKLAEIASCSPSGVTQPASRSTEEAATRCCVFGDFVEWTETECDPVCGSDRYQIRRKRRLQNPVPNLDKQFDPSCDLNKCKQYGESAESRKCDDVSECTSDCVYLEWSDWSECPCISSTSGVSSQTRTRKATAGTICPDMTQQQQCTNALCTEEDNTMTYMYAAGGGIIVLGLLGTTCVYRHFHRRETEQAAPFATL